MSCTILLYYVYICCLCVNASKLEAVLLLVNQVGVLMRTKIVIIIRVTN